jgi:hypothetical protein
MWGFHHCAFVQIDPDLLLFLLHLRTAFFEAHLLSPLKIWQLWVSKSYKVFLEPPYTIVTPSQCSFLFLFIIAATPRTPPSRWLRTHTNGAQKCNDDRCEPAFLGWNVRSGFRVSEVSGSDTFLFLKENVDVVAMPPHS